MSMNYRILMLVLTVMFLNLKSGFSQESWYLSPMVGINLVPINEEGAAGIAHKIGFSGSVLVSGQFDEKWSMQYGVSFNRRYAAYSSTTESQELEELLDFLGDDVLDTLASFADLTTYTHMQGYSQYWTFDIPITLTYKTKNNFIFYGGGFVNFLISNKNTEVYHDHVPNFRSVSTGRLYR